MKASVGGGSQPSEYVKEHAYWGFFDDPIGVQVRDRVGADAGHALEIVLEGGNGNETFLLAEGEIFFAASRRDVYDAGAFSLAHCIPRYHPVYFTRRFRRSPLLFHRYIGNLRREASRITLRLELIERAIIWPSQHLRTRYLAQDFVATFLLEDLFNGLKFGYSLDPFLFPEILFKPLRCKGSFGQIVHFVSMTNP